MTEVHNEIQFILSINTEETSVTRLSDVNHTREGICEKLAELTEFLMIRKSIKFQILSETCNQLFSNQTPPE